MDTPIDGGVYDDAGIYWTTTREGLSAEVMECGGTMTFCGRLVNCVCLGDSGGRDCDSAPRESSNWFHLPASHYPPGFVVGPPIAVAEGTDEYEPEGEP